jgi:hypothetical protein
MAVPTSEYKPSTEDQSRMWWSHVLVALLTAGFFALGLSWGFIVSFFPRLSDKVP